MIKDIRLEEAQTQIELEIVPDQLESYLDQADAARQKARQTRLLCANRLKEISAHDKDKDSTDSEAPSVQAKLPKLELPRFNGEITQWQSFWDQLSSHIDDTDLPSISKLTYLLSLLDGPAKDAVEGVPHTSASYKTVVDLLKERFGKPECIFHSHVQALLSPQVPVDQGKNYITQLWRLRDEAIKYTRSLDALGVTGKQCKVLLTPIIVSIIERSEMYKSNSPAPKPNAKNEEKKKVFGKDNKEKLFTASALHAVSQTENSSCVFCNKKNHKSEMCFKFLALDGQQRFDKLRELGVCFKCLNSGHISKKCKIKCAKCKSNHIVTMCGIKLN